MALNASRRDFVRNVIGKSPVIAGGVVSRTPNSSFPNGFRAFTVTDLWV
jgi:hypothetical protein